MASLPSEEQPPLQQPGGERILPGVNKRGLKMFLFANLVAVVAGILIFWAVLGGDGLTAFLEPVWRFFAQHNALTAMLAVSPLLAALLVGYGYMTRAMRRRAAEALDAGAKGAGRAAAVVERSIPGSEAKPASGA